MQASIVQARPEELARVAAWLRAGRDNAHQHQASYRQRAGFHHSLRKLVQARRERRGG